MVTLIGYLAAACTTVSFIPQVVKVYKTRRTKDISPGMFLLMTTGVVLWLIYGILFGSAPITAANAVTLIFSLYILIMKIRLDIIPAKKIS